MKKNNADKSIEAEAAFATETYRDRAALNRRAQELLATGSGHVEIRLTSSKTKHAKQRDFRIKSKPAIRSNDRGVLRDRQRNH